MQFHLAINLERMNSDARMGDVARHTLDMVRLAEQGGFHTAWAAEHHALEMTIAPNPFQILTWWAMHTEKIRLGSAVAVAAYWHPINLAGEAAFTDLLSGGRLEFGIGSGAYQREFDRMHPRLKQSDAWRYVHEMLPAVKALWAGDYEHDGEFWSFPVSTSVPKPLQKPHPPVWLAARAPVTFNYAVQNNCRIMSWPLTRPFAEVELYKARLEEAVQANPGCLLRKHGPRPRAAETLPGIVLFGGDAGVCIVRRAIRRRGTVVARVETVVAGAGMVVAHANRDFRRKKLPIAVNCGLVYNGLH